jgi:hypothetical protein
MDIGAWLRDLGLGRYAASFEANAIDHEVLSEVTEANLGKLGVPLAHGKKMLKAIADLTASRRCCVSPRRRAGKSATAAGRVPQRVLQLVEGARRDAAHARCRCEQGPGRTGHSLHHLPKLTWHWAWCAIGHIPASCTK